MSIKGKAYIGGVFEHPTREAIGYSTPQLHAECAKGALEDAGLSKDDIDGYFCAAGDTPGLGQISAADYLGLKTKHIDSTDVGGSSYILQVGHAAEAIALGKCSIALITLAGRPRAEGMATGTQPRAPAVPMPDAPVVGVESAMVPVPTLRSVAAVWVMEPPVVLPPVSVATVMVPPEPVVMLLSAAAPVPPAAVLTLIATAFAPAFVVVIAPPAFMVKLSAPAPLVFVLIVIGLEPAPPTLALRATASPLEIVIAPLPVELAPFTVSVPVVLVRLIGPAPVALAVKLAPSDSVMKTPPDPVVAVTVPAVVRMWRPPCRCRSRWPRPASRAPPFPRPR